jgi:hypothetical protein
MPIVFQISQLGSDGSLYVAWCLLMPRFVTRS